MARRHPFTWPLSAAPTNLKSSKEYDDEKPV
jgi:hypothetical protein